MLSTEEEFESLLKLRYKLYEKALAQALEDGTITEDEKDILNQMQKNLQLTRDIVKRNCGRPQG